MLRCATAMIPCWAAVQIRRQDIATGECTEGMTHIIVGAVITRHDDSPAAKLQGEQSRWFEGHDGWEWDGAESLPFPSGCFLFIDGPTGQTSKNEAPHHTEHLLYPTILLCSGSL